MQTVRVARGADHFTICVRTTIIGELRGVIARTVAGGQRQQTLPGAGWNAERGSRNMLTGVGWSGAGPVTLEIKTDGGRLADAEHEGRCRYGTGHFRWVVGAGVITFSFHNFGLWL